MADENLEDLPVGRRQLVHDQAHLAQALRLAFVLHRGNEARVLLIGHQRLGEVAQVLLHSARQRLGLPLLGVGQVYGGVPRLRVNGLAEQTFYLGAHAADPIEALRGITYSVFIQALCGNHCCGSVEFGSCGLDWIRFGHPGQTASNYNVHYGMYILYFIGTAASYHYRNE
jgi:hypothetical protein